MYIKYPHSLRRNVKMLAIAAACLTSSFFLGIQTAGDIQPVSLIEAGGLPLSGDIDGNGSVGLEDVIFILEVSQGYVVASPDQLRADPNGDGRLTVDDALRILSTLSLQ